MLLSMLRYHNATGNPAPRHPPFLVKPSLNNDMVQLVVQYPVGNQGSVAESGAWEETVAEEERTPSLVTQPTFAAANDGM